MINIGKVPIKKNIVNPARYPGGSQNFDESTGTYIKPISKLIIGRPDIRKVPPTYKTGLPGNDIKTNIIGRPTPPPKKYPMLPINKPITRTPGDPTTLEPGDKRLSTDTGYMIRKKM